MTDRRPNDGGRDLRVLQRVVLPVDRDLDVLKLYVDGQIERGAAKVEAEAAPGRAEEGVRPDSASRRTVVVPVGRRVSFATYFNAFPAGYWRRWTNVEETVLRIRIRGHATVIVYRSSAKGHVHRVASSAVDSDTAEDRSFSLPLKPFVDGGWYWFDVVAKRARSGPRTGRVVRRRRAGPAAGHREHRHHDVQPSRLLRGPARRAR